MLGYTSGPAELSDEELAAELHRSQTCPVFRMNLRETNQSGGFLKWGIPKMDGLLGEIPTKMDDVRVPPFMKTNQFAAYP